MSFGFYLKTILTFFQRYEIPTFESSFKLESNVICFMRLIIFYTLCSTVLQLNLSSYPNCTVLYKIFETKYSKTIRQKLKVNIFSDRVKLDLSESYFSFILTISF